MRVIVRRSTRLVRSTSPLRIVGLLLVVAALVAAGVLASEAPAGGAPAAPTTTCDYDGLWHNSPVTLHFSATDTGGPGVAYTQYSTDNGATWVRLVTTNGASSLTVSTMGVKTILYRSVDNAGGVEAVHSVGVKILGVALYAGGNATLSGSTVISSPLVSGQPSAALYVNGSLTTSGSVNLSSVAQYIKAKGATVPPLSQFMPSARVTALITAAQAAQKTGTVYNGLTLSGSANATYSSPITVNGNLTISGSGSYSFNSVYVTGNVAISNSAAKVSFASLYVGGTLNVSGGTSRSWGPTYVAGNTSMATSGQVNLGLFVCAGNVTISGSGTFGGDGVGSDPKPAIVLMTGQSKALTISGAFNCYGLLCDLNGPMVSSGGVAIKGAVVCGGAVTCSGSLAISWNPAAALTTLDVTPPTTSATTSPAANANAWNNSSVAVTLAAVDDPGGSGVASTFYTIDGGAAQTYNKPFTVTGDKVHTVKYWSTDVAGNSESQHSLTISIDTTPPTGSLAINGGAAYTKSASVTLTSSASDATSGVSRMEFSNDGTNYGTPVAYAASSSYTLPATDGKKTVWVKYVDAAGNVSAAASATITLDTTRPTVVGVSSTAANGAYKAGAQIPVTVTFSEPVTVSGTPQLTLATGSPASTPVNYASGSGSTTLTFTYTVAAGNSSAKLDYASASALALNGGTIQDAATNNAVLTLAAPGASGSLGASKAIVIDSTPPTVTVNQAATQADPTNVRPISFTVVFSEPVSAPRSGDFSVGGTASNFAVSYVTGSGTTYTVTLDGSSVTDGTVTLALAAGKVSDPAGNPNLASTSRDNTVTYDGTPPTVTVNQAATQADPTNVRPISFTVVFSEPASGLSTSSFTVGGSATGFAVTGLTAGSGNSYTVTVDGSSVTDGTVTLSLVAGKVRDAAGNGNLASTSSDNTVTYDTSRPTISIDGSPGGWTKGPVVLTFLPVGGPSGIASVECQVTKGGVQGDWTAVLPIATVYQATFSDEGSYTVDCRATNGVGATSAVSTCSFAIDTTPPTVTLTSLDGASTGYNRPAFEFSASDAGGSQLSSGPTLKVDGQVVDATSGEALAHQLSDGDHTVTVTAQDNAGNTTVQTCHITITTPTFAVSPDTPNEGDIVGLYATATGDTGNADGSQDGKTWLWSISRGNETPDTYEGPVGYIVPDTAADYHIQLTVTDTQTGSKSVISKTITVKPMAPRVHALNVEVLDGQSATLVGRFLDPGWTQTHTATFNLPNMDPIQGTVLEDNQAAMDSGYVSAVTPPLTGANSVLVSSLTVTDSTGQSTTVPFTIHILPNDSTSATADEGSNGNDTISSLTPVLDAGQAHLSFIQSAGDVDIFEVKTPNDKPLPYGTEVLATLRNLPADYDLAIIQDLGSNVDTNKQNANFESSSFATSPNTHGPFEDYPNTHGPNTHGPNTHGPNTHGPYEDYPNTHGPFLDWPNTHGPNTHGPALSSPYLDYPNTHGPNTHGPNTHGPFFDSPNTHGPNTHGPDNNGQYARPPFLSMMYTYESQTTGNSLDGYSFSDMSWTDLNNNRTGGNDISPEELGFNNEQLVGKRFFFSAASGTTNDVVMATTDFANGHTYVAVKGANGAFSATQPYTLQVETSVPTETLDTMNAGITPSPAPIVPGGGTTPVTECSPPSGVAPLTLFVTQAQRIDALYGDGTNSATAQGQPFEHLLQDELQTVCNDPKVAGKVISVPASIYDAWDSKPWDPQLANDVAQKIRGIIDSELLKNQTIKYVVLVGSDEVIPQYRVPDLTVLGNEREYVQDSYLKSTSPLVASMFDSMVLTDDYYADTKPIAYGGHDLCIPDLAVSRLVETPSEIFKTLDTFEQQKGILAGGTAVVTGQDWMTNGAQRVAGFLDAAVPDPANNVKVEPLDTWQGNDVRKDVFNNPTNAWNATADVSNINAHFSHYGGISAYGHNQELNDSTWWDPSEFLSSKDIATASKYTGKLFFTLGCHAGLNVPDDQTVPLDLGADPAIDPRLDVAQAMAQQGGVLVASTGYGFGDTVTITGTEALIGTFADEATAADAASPASGTTPESGQPIGLALAAAKRQYLGSLTTVSPYDEKSSVQFTMYGMPQYRLACNTHDAPPDVGLQASGGTSRATASLMMGARQAAAQQSVTAPATFTLNVVDGGTKTPYTATLTPAAGGTYYTACYTADGASQPTAAQPGDAQATADRPIQPRVVVDLGSGGDNPVRAVVVTGGSYVDIPDFNPAISRITNEWEVNVAEFQVSSDGWWPANPATVTTITGATQGGTEQRLVVLPGQFLATSADGDPVSGTERLWSSLTVKLIRGAVPAAGGDTISPRVNSVTLSNNGDTWTAHIDAQDSGKIADIDVTQIGTQVGGDNASSFDFPIEPATASGPFNVHFTLPHTDTGDVSIMVAVSDVAGNTTTVTAKGRLITSPPEGSMTLNGGAAVTYTPLVTIDSDVVHADELRASTDNTNWSDWMPYQAKVVVNLPGLPDDKTVWVQYRNADPTVLERSAPIRLASAPIGAGAYQSLATKSDGSLSAWGWNGFGQLGDGSTADSHVPEPIGAATDWLTVGADETHTLALRSSHTLWAWGLNSNGQLGDGSTSDSHVPKQIGSATNWVAVSSGGYYSLALRSDGTLWAWGHNDHGQLGDGTTNDSHVPEQIGSATNWVAVSAGVNHSLALKSDGTLWAWGHNGSGQLGDGTTSDSRVPERIGSATNWVAVSAGNSHSLALRSDGTLWAWGANQVGELGDGNPPNQSNVPEQIGTATDWTAVVAGNSESLALKSDGTLWAWGDDAYGKLGDGSTANQDVPERIGSDTNWVAVSAGDFHCLALKSDGTLWAWGLNSNGQLGDGTTNDSHVPEQVGIAKDWVDAFAPTTTATVLPMPNAAGWNRTQVMVSLSAVDNAGGSGVWGSEYSIDQQPWIVGPASTAFAVTGDGTHTVRYFAVDNAGNVETTKTLTVKIDTTPPVASITSPADGGTVATATPQLVYNVSDANLASVVVQVDGATVNKTSGDTLDSLPDGQHTVTVTGTDEAGNQTTATSTFTVAAPVAPTVTSPNGGESWFTGSNHTVTWTPGNGGPVTIDISRDGGSTWTTLWTAADNTGFLSWTVSGPATGQALVRVTNSSGSDTSNAAFTIADPVPPTVTSPTGGESWVVGSNHTVTWTPGNGGPVNVEVSRDNGVHWQMIAASTANDGSQPWTVDGPATSQALVRITNDAGSGVSSAAFTIADQVAPAITSPNGGESWPVNSSQTITWTPGNGGDVTIELSRDNGASWETVFASTPNDGSQPWTVSGPGTGQALVRVSNTSGSDLSDADFQIGSFAGKVDYTAGSEPWAVAVGDFNGDGKQDMAVADWGTNQVSVFSGNGDGTFAAKVDYTTDWEPNAVAIGDFNRDGKPDLVTANANFGTVSILLGSGSGSFPTHVEYLTGAASGCCSVAVGDFNGDGKQDLVTASQTTNTVSVLLGNGDGSFGTASTYSGFTAPWSVAVGDFNGDGKQDLAVANYGSGANSVSILLGNGDGTFASKNDYSTGSGTRPFSIAVGDFNHDGKQDLAAAINTGVSVLTGNGTGAFPSHTNYTVGPTEAVAIGDANGDGNQDLLTAGRNMNGQYVASVLGGDGTGSFNAAVGYVTGGKSPGGSDPRAIACADFNGDGSMDLATANFGGNSVSVLLQRTGSTPRPVQFATHVDYATGSVPKGTAVGDFNGDGKQDLAVANYNANTIGVLLGNGNGTFHDEVAYATGNGPRAVSVTDVNHDGKQDLVTANLLGDTVSVLLGNGDGTFQAKVDYPTGTGNYNPNSVAIADLDRDGWQDIVTGDYAGLSFCLLKGLSGGTFPSMGMGISIGSPQASVAIADVNRDGKPDAVTADYATNKVSVRLGNGDLTFGTRVDYAVGTDPEDVAIADLNGDGRPDILVANYSTNTLSVLLGNGDGTFQAKSDYATGAGPRAIAVADLNRDGKLDVVTADDTAGSVSVLAGNGDGTLQPKVDYPVGVNPYDVTVADVNGDGKPDLVTANSGANTSSVLLNTTSP